MDQSFMVTGRGDNYNQCVGIQDTAITGNARNTINLVSFGGEMDDF